MQESVGQEIGRAWSRNWLPVSLILTPVGPRDEGGGGWASTEAALRRAVNERAEIRFVGRAEGRIYLSVQAASGEALSRFVGAADEALERNGLAVRWRVAPSKTPAYRHPLTSKPSVTLVASLPVDAETSVPPRIWDIDRGALEAAVDIALRWCGVEGGREYLKAGSYFTDLSVHVKRTLFEQAVDTLVGRERGATVHLEAVAWPREARVIQFTDEARVHFVVATPDLDVSWAEVVEDLTGQLRSLAPWITYGAIVRAAEIPITFSSYLSQSRGVPSAGMDVPGVTRFKETSQALDVFGVQYLGGGFDLDDAKLDQDFWTAEPLDQGVILSAEDLSAWFATEHELSLGQARRRMLVPVLQRR